jgi:hypothetical protein
MGDSSLSKKNPSKSLVLCNLDIAMSLTCAQRRAVSGWMATAYPDGNDDAVILLDWEYQ